jgi:nitrogen fixation protein NifQ
MPAPTPDYAALIAAARCPDDPATLACAGVIALAPSRRAPYNVPVAGLERAALVALTARLFPGLSVSSEWADGPPPPPDSLDEFDDLLALLREHRSHEDELSEWLAHALATAAMADNHLWQDLGLPSRRELSLLMQTYFASLAQRNAGDMKWKKFLYRQLCERAGLTICRSPSCAVCSDYPQCFGPEEAQAGYGGVGASSILL